MEKKIYKIIEMVRKRIKEDVPVNNISSGNIAGSVESGDDPPVRKKKKKYIYGGNGSRKLWMNNKKNG